MKILFLALDIDLGLERGDAIHASSLAISLSRLGHQVHMVVGAAGKPVDSTGLHLSVRPRGGDVTLLLQLRHVAKRFRPDIIYERRFSPKISAALSIIARTPFVVECNGIVEDEAAMQGRPISMGSIGRLQAFIRVSMLRRSAAVVAVTPRLRDFVVGEYGVPPDKAHVVENGVDPSLFRPMDRSEARAALGLSQGPTVAFVGNLVLWQGIRTLLEALRAVPSVRLIVVGDGPAKPELIALAETLELSDRVDFVGGVSHQQVPQYIAASDACAAPFTAERNQRSGVSPLKLYEYLACARPVIVTAIDGARELVEGIGCGLVVPPDDPAAMGVAIQTVLQDPKFPYAATRASEVVRREHSWDRVAVAVARVLQSVCGPLHPLIPVSEKHTVTFKRQ